MFRTISSRRVLVLAVRLLVDLLEVRGVLDGVTFGVTRGDWMISAEETLGTGIWHGAGAGSRGGAGVVVVLRGRNSGVCVELEVVTGLGGERGDTGGGGLGGLGTGVGSGSGGLMMVRDKGTGGGEGGAGGAGGGDGKGGGGLKDGEGAKDRDRGDNGDKPASSLSISRSNFTKPGGSTPYLAAIRPSSIRHRHTSRGCLCRTKPSDSNR